MMSTLRSTEVPFAASIASRITTAGRSAGGQLTSAPDQWVGPVTSRRCESSSRTSAPSLVRSVRWIARPSYTQSWMSVWPLAHAAMTTKNGRLSMLSPGNGMGWILSIGACSSLGYTVTSTRRVRPLSARYSGVSE